MMEKKFDPTKPVQTRDGRKARIICTDRDFDGYPIIALIRGTQGQEGFETYGIDGKASSFMEHELDLINVP